MSCAISLQEYVSNNEFDGLYKRIGSLKGKYEAVVLKYTMSNLSDIMQDYADDLGEYADEVREGVEGFIEGMAEEFDDSDYNFCCDSTDI